MCLAMHESKDKKFVLGLQMTVLVCWILFTKIVKIIPNLVRYPADAKLVSFQVLFAYWHGLIKFWALVTFWDCDWSGRKLDLVDGDIGEDGRDLKATKFFTI